MTAKKYYVLRVERGFSDGVILKFRLPNLYTIIVLTKIKKDFLKEEVRVKGFFLFMTMLSFKEVESMVKRSPTNEVVVGLLSFLII